MGRVKELADSLAIPLLKREAAKHYVAYEDAAGAMSCGKALAEQVSGTVLAHKLAFNAAMDRLAQLDTSCPKFRL